MFEFFQLKDLRQKILFTLIIIFIYRFGGHIPIPGVDLQSIRNLFDEQGVLGFFNLFSGGSLERFSLFALGILPYINASIIMQLLTIMYPKLKELAEEGEIGRKQLSQYTRFLAIGLAFIQALVMSLGFRHFLFPGINYPLFLCYSVVVLVAGAALVMWLGELITEYGIGNGASLLIFVGIIAQLPSYIRDTIVLVSTGTSIFRVMVLMAIFLAIIVGIVFVQEAQRRVPVQYAKKIVGRKMYSGQSTFLPLRLIQGGVMPIIFASALLQFPLMFSQYLNVDFLKKFFSVYYTYDGIVYNFLFCFFIFFFTYFYTAISFNPQEIAQNVKKYGGFILGVRPGRPTVDYLEKIVSKLTFMGAIFLSCVAFVPVLSANLTNVKSFMGLGGTALLIMVGVAMDIVKQIEIYLISRKYESYLK